MLRDESKRTRGRNGKQVITLHDEKGFLRESGEDLCDCMITDCPGCHFPCPKCESKKCGSTCRINRRWTYDVVYYDTK